VGTEEFIFLIKARPPEYERVGQWCSVGRREFSQ
jgi:hypothetical protein